MYLVGDDVDTFVGFLIRYIGEDDEVKLEMKMHDCNC